VRSQFQRYYWYFNVSLWWLGVTVHDHLIIGRGRHTSLRDLGLI
jgi:hypothetical protein